MKVSYRGRVRKINVIPSNMEGFRRSVQSKFLNCHLTAPDEEHSQAMSRMMDDSEINGDNTQFASMIDQSISQRQNDGDESKAMGRGKKLKREKNTIDFQECVVFYEDSEGDLNVISEDEDLADATTYVLQHKAKALKCTIVPKKFYEDLRNEQMSSELNQSATWMNSDLNQFRAKAQKEKRVRKQKKKE